MDEEQKQSTQPLYEFVAEDANLNPGVVPGREGESSEGTGERNPASLPLPTDEEIRRGLIYPPPPSFYQNMHEVSGPPVVPSGEGSGRYPEASAASSAERAIGDPRAEMGQYRGPNPPYIPVPSEVKPQAKRSRAWIWIVASVLGAALLVSCGLCGWGMYSIFSSTFQQVVEPLTVAQNYYSALQAKNYSLAYSYLSPQGAISGLTLDEFTQQANTRDSQLGSVRSYNPGQPAFNTSTSATGTSNVDLSRATITVDVTRSQQNYSVLLTMQKIGGRWKIVDFDRL
jgi:hypothetical protein